MLRRPSSGSACLISTKLCGAADDQRDQGAALGGWPQAEARRARRGPSRPGDERTRRDARRTTSLAHREARHEGQRRLPLEKAATSRADTQKKSLRAAEQDRLDVAKAREGWRASQPDLNPEHLVFIDETRAKTNMVRLYGRAPRGHRLVGQRRMVIG